MGEAPVGRGAMVPDKVTLLGRPRLRQAAPSLGSVRRSRQKALGSSMDSENLVGHSLASMSCVSVMSERRVFQEIICVPARHSWAGPEDASYTGQLRPVHGLWSVEKR